MEESNEKSALSECGGSSLAKAYDSSMATVSGGWDSFLKKPYMSNDASLFSSSLPVLPHKKLNYNGLESDGPSFDANTHMSKELREGKAPIEGLDSNEVGVILPSDDELLAGIMDDLDLNELPTQLEDLEDYDIFGSGGGMELDSNPQERACIGFPNPYITEDIVSSGINAYAMPNGLATVAGEHPYGEHPSRTLFVRNINSNVEDSELRSLFEQYGDIRTLYTACKHRGFVMISYFDIRHARAAMRALQNKPLRRRKLDIHFSIPKDNPSEKDINQGTLVVFNLDPSVSNDDLYQIFGVHGEIKEIRETPNKRHHKFIEFYDVRDAESALKALNRSDIAGKRIKLEPSRPGGTRRNFMQQVNYEFEQDESRSFRQSTGSPLGSSPPGSWGHLGSPVDQSLLRGISQSPIYSPISPGLASLISLPISNATKIPPIGKDVTRSNQLNQFHASSMAVQDPNSQHSHSFPGQKYTTAPFSSAFAAPPNTSSSGVGALYGSQSIWGSVKPYSELSNSSVWSTPLHPSREGSLLGSHNRGHHVGSAPSAIPESRYGFGILRKSPETSLGSPPAYGGLSLNCSRGSYMMNRARSGIGSVVRNPVNTTENPSPSFQISSLPWPNSLLPFNDSLAGSGIIMNDVLSEHGRVRRIDSSVAQIDNKKQYQLDLEKISSGEDTRTTLMIKNIPNKYTSKMLLAAIDESHSGTYDFLYLPIDFKNKCNVGYAFINMVSAVHIVQFYKAFNGKKWEKFNSEKVALLAYARIQGKAALVAHFQNSSLMNEEKCFRPILFQPEGQAKADEDVGRSENLECYYSSA